MENPNSFWSFSSALKRAVLHSETTGQPCFVRLIETREGFPNFGQYCKIMAWQPQYENTRIVASIRGYY